MAPQNQEELASREQERQNIARSAATIVLAIDAYRRRHPEARYESDETVLELIANELRHEH